MKTSFETLLGPMKELSDLTLKSIEQITEIQIKTIQENAKVSMDALKASADVKDLASLKSYMEDQATAVKTLSETAVEDVNQIVSLNSSYVTDIKDVVEKTVTAA